MSAPLVLLHGFSQTGASWSRVTAALRADDRPVATPDLRGHGTAGEQRPAILPAMAADVMAHGPDGKPVTAGVANGPLALGGYSMGGRVALLAALASPGRVSHLALISSTAGIDDEAGRRARAAADDELAAEIEAMTIDQVADRWSSHSLFNSQVPDDAEFARADRLRSDPAGLAAALRGAGTGRMGSLWDALPSLTMPVLVMAGQRDEKFCAIGKRLAAAIPDAEYVVVPGAGHQLPVEAPELVARALEGLLSR